MKVALKYIAFIFMIGILNLNSSLSQITFNKTYHDQVDGIFNILVENGYYFFVMHSMNSPYRSYVFHQVDTIGDILISKKYGGSPETYLIYSLVRTYDNYFAIGSYCYDLQNSKGYALLGKFDQSFDTIWLKKFLPPPGFNFNGDYMIETNDRGFLITGQIVDSLISDGDIFILKTDSLGNFEWMNNFGGPLFDAGYASVQTSDGGYLTSGWTRSFGFGSSGNRDDIVVKWDSLGNYQWHQTYGTTNYETGIGITKTSDGNFVVASGRYILPNGPSQGKIIKIDESGSVIWQKYQSGEVDAYNWVREMSNFDLVAISSARVNNLDDGFVIRTDSSGNEKWRRQYRFGNSHCYFRDVQETPDGGIICAGFVFQGASGGQDGWLVKLDSTGCLAAGSCGVPTGLFEAQSASDYEVSVYPNPVKDQAIVKIDGLPQRLMDESYRLRVYDLQGRLVQEPVTGFLVADNWIQCIFNRRDLNSGIYLLEVSSYSNEKLSMVKVLVE